MCKCHFDQSDFEGLDEAYKLEFSLISDGKGLGHQSLKRMRTSVSEVQKIRLKDGFVWTKVHAVILKWNSN